MYTVDEMTYTVFTIIYTGYAFMDTVLKCMNTVHTTIHTVNESEYTGLMPINTSNEVIDTALAVGHAPHAVKDKANNNECRRQEYWERPIL
jgi:hypothetical protein